MKRTITAIVFFLAIGSQLPAQGFQTQQDASVRPQLATIQQTKERVRERVRERLNEWYGDKIAALLEPEPVAPAAPSTPAPTTSYPSGVLTAEQVASYARGAGFPESVIDTMVAIAYRESRFNPGAINSSSGACGLWQLYPCPGSDALEPARNAALAYSKYAASGLSPWGG